MNKFRGQIANIDENESLSLVTIQFENEIYLKAIVIDTSKTASYLKLGHGINVLFNENEVIIGKKSNYPISIQNKINGSIKQIEQGRIISKIIVNSKLGEIVSIVSTDAIKELHLHENEEIVAMIKLNEIILTE